ncbi:MAG: hypothetical protein OXI30_06410 [Chloroflexota bacterium]|nr:hypothetical protein [Chloroflexota bacterium]
MGTPEIMFSRSPEGIGEALRQGEILTDVVELQIEPRSIESVDADSIYDINPIKHPFAIIVSQDCDLEQGYNFTFHNRGNLRNELPTILFCQAQDVDKFRKSEMYQNLFKEGPFRRDFRNNDAFRYHFIQAIPTELDTRNCGLPELGIDFKRYFSIPIVEVFRRIELGHTCRRTVLESPYRDHFSRRFFNFNSRVALPEEYEST